MFTKIIQEPRQCETDENCGQQNSETYEHNQFSLTITFNYVRNEKKLTLDILFIVWDANFRKIVRNHTLFKYTDM